VKVLARGRILSSWMPPPGLLIVSRVAHPPSLNLVRVADRIINVGTSTAG
jgi:hypothetical protein